MPFVLGIAESLALKNVSEVTSAVVANDLSPHHTQTRVWLLSNSTGYGVPESGPPAARVEHVVCFVKRCVTATAGIDTRVGVVLVVFARTGWLGTLLSQNTELL